MEKVLLVSLFCLGVWQAGLVTPVAVGFRVAPFHMFEG
jgi:hypothetical protein